MCRAAVHRRLPAPVWQKDLQSCTLPARMRVQAVLLLVVVVLVLATTAATFPQGRRCNNRQSWFVRCNRCACINGMPVCTSLYCGPEGKP
ncbi:hypothetical protein O3P69_014802 [Scylla paramamosain]|uniref:Pacifastin domain-containing protein n=1 Tax=Scylla paramamosain TaxID=85552 RepID=A0AAW0TXY7_SCYPA